MVYFQMTLTHCFHPYCLSLRIRSATSAEPRRASPERKAAPNKKKAAEASSAALLEAAKLTGPVNGNECYFWRTTGCLYADKCRYEHLKRSKGVDKKPWHKQ